MLTDFLKVIKGNILNNTIFFSFFYFLRRRIFSFNTKATLKNNIKYRIDKDLGFLKLQLKDKEIFKAIQYCKNEIKPIRVNENKQKDSYLYTYKLDVFKNKPILDLAKNEKIVSIIANYFKTIPILYYAAIWHSKGEQNTNYKGSQLYHFDREDLYQIKLFIPIKPILEDSGPLNVFDAKATSYFVKKSLAQFNLVSKKDRFLDSQIKNILKEKEPIKLTGRVGELIFVDTTNCLHYGSRDCKNGKYHLTLQYLTPYSTKLGSFIKKNKDIESVLSYLEWKRDKKES